MLILVDARMPEEAKLNISTYGEAVEFSTKGITYPAISDHPDIFFCPTPKALIVAPNLPDKYFLLLQQRGINYVKGEKSVGFEYPASACYNTHATENLIVHNPSISDPRIRSLNPDLHEVKVKQGYVRCNLIALSDGSCVTSDRGIEKALIKNKTKTLFVDPSGIKLPGFDHGFFGGVCGVAGDTLFICGSLDYFSEKQQIENFVTGAGMKIVELYEGPPFDAGTILFIDS